MSVQQPTHARLTERSKGSHDRHAMISSSQAAAPASPTDFCTLRLPGLPVELAELRSGRLYVTSTDNDQTAAALARSIAAGLPEGSSFGLLAPREMADNFLRVLPREQGPGRMEYFQCPDPLPPTVLRAIPADLRRARLHLPDVLVAVLPAEAFRALDSAALQAWCESLRTVLAGQDSRLWLLLHDDTNGTTHRAFQACHEQVAGLGRIRSVSDRQRYEITWWATKNALLCGQHWLLDYQSAGLHWLAGTETLPPADVDQHRLIIQRNALPSAEISALADFDVVILDDNADVIALAEQARLATLVFSLSGGVDVAELSRHIRRLRQDNGAWLKILVSEGTTPLRRADQTRLLACGTNQILPAGTNWSRFLATLDAVQGQGWFRQLPHFIATAADIPAPAPGGVLRTTAFVGHVQAAYQDGRSAAVQHALVILQPREGLRAADLAEQVVLQRAGDAVCATVWQVALFLHDCPASYVQTALDAVWQAPVENAFSHFEVITAPAERRQALRDLLRAPVMNVAAAAAAPVSAAMAEATPTETGIKPGFLSRLSRNAKP